MLGSLAGDKSGTDICLRIVYQHRSRFMRKEIMQWSVRYTICYKLETKYHTLDLIPKVEKSETVGKFYPCVHKSSPQVEEGNDILGIRVLN